MHTSLIIKERKTRKKNYSKYPKLKKKKEKQENKMDTQENEKIQLYKLKTYPTTSEYVRNQVTGSIISQEYSKYVKRPTKPN